MERNYNEKDEESDKEKHKANDKLKEREKQRRGERTEFRLLPPFNSHYRGADTDLAKRLDLRG